MKQTSNAVHSSRWLYVASAALVLALGWCARAHSLSLPPFIGTYAPDTLWALMVFLLIGVLKPHLTTCRASLIAFSVAYGIEFSQLYQAPWINVIRATRLGGLVLGHGFLWSDLLCYGIGIGMGASFQVIHGRRNNHPAC